MNLPVPPFHPSADWIEAALLPPPASIDALEATIEAFEAAAAFACATGCRQGTAGYAVLHRLCYRATRERYGLSANLTVRAIACAARRLKGEPSAPLPTVEYDRRVFSLGDEARVVSLSAVGGRLRSVPWNAGPVERRRCLGGCPDAAQLVRRGAGRYRFRVHLARPTPLAVAARGRVAPAHPL